MRTLVAPIRPPPRWPQATTWPSSSNSAHARRWLAKRRRSAADELVERGVDVGTEIVRRCRVVVRHAELEAGLDGALDRL